MLKTVFCSAIVILTLLGTTGCGSDPASASGAHPDDHSGHNNGGTTQSSSLPAQPPAASPAVSGQPAMSSGGMGNAGGPGQAPPANTGVQPTNWLTYTSQPFNFSISYPDLYAVADQGNLPQDVPNLVQRVRFLDKALAASPTANLQPPELMIDVFENKDGLVLEDWIAANERRGTPIEAKIGNQQGYRVMLQTMQAPNQFYFVSHGQYVYRLTPLGLYAEDMIHSLKLG